MAVGALQLFLNVDTKQLVESLTSGTVVSLPTFFQNDVYPIDLTLLNRNPSGGLRSPHTLITAQHAVKLAVVTPSPSSSGVKAQVTPTFNASTSVYSGNLDLSPAAITTLLNGASTVSTTFEIEWTYSGAVSTAQFALTLNADGIKNSSTAPDPTDQYYTKAQTDAGFVSYVLPAGKGIQFTSADGTYSKLLYLGNDGIMHEE